MKCWGSEQSFWTKVPLQYIARRLSNEGRASTLTCVQVLQTSWSSWCLQYSNQPCFPARHKSSGILAQEAGDESCYDLCADLTPCSNRTKIYSNFLVWKFPLACVLLLTSHHAHFILFQYSDCMSWHVIYCDIQHHDTWHNIVVALSLKIETFIKDFFWGSFYCF